MSDGKGGSTKASGSAYTNCSGAVVTIGQCSGCIGRGNFGCGYYHDGKEDTRITYEPFDGVKCIYCGEVKGATRRFECNICYSKINNFVTCSKCNLSWGIKSGQMSGSVCAKCTGLGYIETRKNCSHEKSDEHTIL